MKKITKPCKPEEEENILTEGINYFKTGKRSIWGAGDKDTLELLKRIRIHGKWLNLAAGDGRYNLDLLKKVDFVVASDIDKSALSKLWYNTPKEYRTKLDTKVFDITKEFPFEDGSFDGIFCTGTLHLFQKEILQKIFYGINRVLKPNGRVVIDFAAEIKRISPNGKLITFGSEPKYTLDEAKTTLKNLFKNYRVKMYESKIIEDFQGANPPYKLNCIFILLVADKK